LVDVADPIAGDPELLGTVMVQLAVIAGEALKLSVDGTAADAEQLLRRITAVRDQ
jgi:hypothetical protein